MSMNSNNLENKVNELTDAIKGLSNKSAFMTNDMDGMMDKLIKRFESANIEGLEKFGDEMSRIILKALGEKHREIDGRLSDFEKFINSAERTVNSSKIESEISRILNDIEALYSKMNSQEIQTGELKKSFDSFKNFSSASQISKISDEIISISRSYDGIAEVLNNNFEEFLKRLEGISSREEFQRLRNYLEEIEGNQNVLVSAMNAVNDKQEEIKYIIKQNSSPEANDRFENLMGALSELNRLILDNVTKSDLDIISDKINALANYLNEFKRSFDNMADDNSKTVIQNEINTISSKIDTLKTELNTANLSEDILRLYSSLAEFKDGITSALAEQFGETGANLETYYDKISNSLVNSNLDTNEAIGNLTTEIQNHTSSLANAFGEKINTMSEGVTAKIAEEVQKCNSSVADIVTSKAEDTVREITDGVTSAIQNNNPIITEAINSKADSMSGDIISAVNSEIQNNNSTLTEVINSKADSVSGDIISAVASEIQNNNSTLTEVINSKAESVTLDIMTKISEEIQNHNNSVTDTINAKTEDIKEDVKNANFAAREEFLNLLKDKFQEITSEIEGFKNNDNLIAEITKNAESIKESFNLDSLSDKIEQVKITLGENNTSITSSKETICENLNLLGDKIEAFNQLLDKKTASANEEGNNIANEIKEKTESIQGEIASIKEAVSSEKSFSDIKNEIEHINEVLQGISKSAIIEQFEMFEQNILSSSIDNIKEIKDLLGEFNTRIFGNIDVLRAQITAIQTKEERKEPIIPALDVFEKRLHEKLISLESLVAQNYGTGYEKIKNEVVQNLEGIKKEIQSGAKSLTEEFVNIKFDTLYEFIKNQWTEVKIEFANYLKQQAEEIATILGEKTVAKDNEMISKFSKLLEQSENSESRLNFISDVTKYLYEIQDSTLMLKTAAGDEKALLEDVKNDISSILNKLNEQKTLDLTGVENSLEEIKGELQNGFDSVYMVKDKLYDLEEHEKGINETNSKVYEVIEGLNNSLKDRDGQITEAIEKTFEKLNSVITSDEANQNINNKINEINANAEILNSKTADLISQNNSDIKSSIQEVKNFIEENANHIHTNNSDIKSSIQEVKNCIEENTAHIHANINGARELITSIEEIMRENLKDEVGISEDTLNKLSSLVEEKIQQKFASLENLIEESSRRFDSKTSEAIGLNVEAYGTKLDDKIDYVVEELNSKVSTIQKAVDDKVYEIVSRNNDIIKDELKLRAEAQIREILNAFNEKIGNLETNTPKNSEGEENQETYTLTDVEADIAKIRLGLEKSNKLSNFKEFAARLVELKNINLENAKMARVIGSDIVRFDSFMKNVTAKIDALAQKFDKSEKIKLDDIKTRLIQSEKQVNSPQKIEEAIASIYKKAKSQENKMEDILYKLDVLTKNQETGFDSKEFIDICYNNTQQTKNLAERLNNMESKMELIQSKIDYIISSCITEE